MALGQLLYTVLDILVGQLPGTVLDILMLGFLTGGMLILAVTVETALGWLLGAAIGN